MSMSKIDVVEDESQEAAPGEPRTESARATAEGTSRQRHEVLVSFVKGYPSHPIIKEEVDEKALGLMTLHLGVRRSKEVADIVNHVEKLTSMKELLRLISLNQNPLPGFRRAGVFQQFRPATKITG